MKSIVRDLACLFMLVSLAESAKANDIKFRIAADWRQVDNANLQRDDDKKLSLLEKKYDFGSLANYQNDFIYFNSDYTVRNTVYVDDYTTLSGKSEFILGDLNKSLGLRLSNSRLQLLKAPDAADTPGNREERNINAAEPQFVYRLYSSDSILLKGDFEQISFRGDSSKKSERVGGMLGWVRSVSAVDSIKIILQKNNIRFDNFPEGGYEYQNIFGLYSTNLNRIQYSLSVGKNRVVMKETEQKYDEPTYNLNAVYRKAGQVFKFDVAQTITDSSRSEGGGVGEITDTIGATQKNIELIRLRSESLKWETDAVCERCVFGLGMTHKTKFFQTSNLESVENQYRTNLGYKITRMSSVKLLLSYTEHDFSLESPYGSYNVKSLRVSYNRTLYDDLNFELYAITGDRKSVIVDQTYKEKFIGLKLSYSF